MKLTLSDELTKAACILSMKAHKHNQNQDYLTKKLGVSSSSSVKVLIIAFKGSMEINDFYQGDHFGETKVDLFPSLQFPSLQRIGEGKLAKVNRSSLQIFQNLLPEKSKLKLEVEKAVEKGKSILFTGHSSGGAIASLATLWMLDEYTRKQKVKLPIGCVTFGSPLIGDGTLTHAVRREKWADYFTHFVMEHDIVPRMMLAPKASVKDYLPSILRFFQQKVNPVNGASEFFENVLINASTAASHEAYDLLEPTNSLKEKLLFDFVEVSPYRPFGVYIFCTRGEDSSSPRQQLVVENPNAALQLFYFFQLPNESQDLAKFAFESLEENFGYEEELNKNGLRLEQRVNMQDLYDQLWTSNGTTGDVVRTKNKVLYDLTADAKWCLLAVEEAEKRKVKNMDEIKKSMREYKSEILEPTRKIIEDMNDKMLKYKQEHGDGANDYYEAFKLQNEQDDFNANVDRLEQAKIWDLVIEMVMRKDLPDEFETWDELVKLATQFRRLYEPLDIANYYRHLKGDDNKGLTYMQVRPKRYKFTQRWYEHANVTGFEQGSESNFVAAVEELTKDSIRKKKTTEEVEKDLEIIKEKIKNWKADKKIIKEDVFWGEAALSKLEATLMKAN